MGILALAALIAAVTWLAFWLDHHVPWFSKMGASLLALVFGALLSNAGLVPASSPLYDAIAGPVTSLAIAWLLLSVNMSDLRIAGRRMLGAFGLALAGTALGALVGAALFAGRFGDQSWRLSGTLTGTYSGGSVNFVSVGRALELPEALFVGANAADALTTGLWLAATLTAPLWLGRVFGSSGIPVDPHGPGTRRDGSHGMGTAAVEVEASAVGHPFFERVGVSTLDLGSLVAMGLVLLVASEWLGALVPVVPSILWLTTLALIVGHTPRFARAPGAMQLGNLALHFFFVVIGIWSRVADILEVGVEVFLFTLTVVGIHGLVVYGAGRAARLDVGTLSVASQAAIGGPSSALAVAVAREWKHLVLPGVIVGLLGYAVGNYLGLAVAGVARSLFGG